MTDPPQLKVASRHGLSKALLESACDDHSAPGAAQRALHALSISASVTAVGGAVSASASQGTSGTVAGVTIVKWIGLGLIAGVTTLVSVDYAISGPSGEVRAPALGALRASSTRTLAVTDSQIEPLRLLPLASEQLRLPELRASRVSAAPPPSARPGEPLSDQLAALREIRSALAAGAPERAAILLETFERVHRGSSLEEEATVLRIEVLADLGRRDARTAAEAFLRLYPHSAYANRVRSKLGLL